LFSGVIFLMTTSKQETYDILKQKDLTWLSNFMNKNDKWPYHLPVNTYDTIEEYDEEVINYYRHHLINFILFNIE